MSIQNLDQRFSITDKNGNPTDYFMRIIRDRGQAQSDTDTSVSDLIAQMLTKAAKTTKINTGTGLSGGGDLSADRTLILANTAVTPGTYGDSSHVAQVTVDAQGRLTAASAVAIAGGGSGSITKIGTVTVTGAVAATVSFTGIPATYSDLLFYARHRGDNAAAAINFNLRFNNDSGANYDTSGVVQVNNAGPAGLTTAAATSMQIGISSAAGAVNANKFGTTKGEIIQYANTAMEKSCITDSYDNCLNTIATIRWQRYAGDWRSTAAINRIDFIPSSGNWAIGTVFTLYGRS